MSTISFHNMDASKIYSWTKYIYDQNISMTKIYLWAKYIHGKNISMTKICLWVKYILNINMNHTWKLHDWYFVTYGWMKCPQHGCICSSVLCWHNGSTNLPGLPAFFLSHIYLEPYPRNWILPFRSHLS